MSCQASALRALAGGPVFDAARVRDFWRRVERYSVGSQICLDQRRGSHREVVIISGWACELRLLVDGRRQIFGFLLPGDVIQARATSGVGSQAVVALTRLEVVAAHPEGADPASREAVRQALAESALRKEERLYDHMVRMGRLTARERVVHLLLELCERLECVGLVRGDTFKIPITQELFADALGLSVVHINRTLKELRREGLVTIRSGSVSLRNRAQLAERCSYRPAAEVAARVSASLRHSLRPYREMDAPDRMRISA